MPLIPLLDGFGRAGTDLRLSVTDRCNFRCLYCMPQEGLEWLPRDEILSFAEMVRLVGILVGCGGSPRKLSRWRRPACAASTYRWIRCGPSASTRSPGAMGSRRCCGAWRRPRPQV